MPLIMAVTFSEKEMCLSRAQRIQDLLLLTKTLIDSMAVDATKTHHPYYISM